jgi:hypothetical protein
VKDRLGAILDWNPADIRSYLLNEEMKQKVFEEKVLQCQESWKQNLQYLYDKHFMDSDGQVLSLDESQQRLSQARMIALYYVSWSHHYANQMTAKLSKKYREVFQKQGLEIIFITDNKNEDQVKLLFFGDHTKTNTVDVNVEEEHQTPAPAMPWLMLDPAQHRGDVEVLKKALDINVHDGLLLFNPNGTIVIRNAAEANRRVRNILI